MLRKHSGLYGPVHVVGLGCTSLVPEQDAVLDELVFDAVSTALAECAFRKPDVGLAVQASMDVYDGRSISSGLTTAAATGYLSDSYRIEGDAGLAIIAAADAIAAGDVEVAVAVAVFNPETSADPPGGRPAFLQQLSSLAFEPIFDRPIGITANVAWAMQAARAVEAQTITVAELAERAAEQLNRAGRAVTAADVLKSPPVAWPLHELMLPRQTAGAAAVVLASPARAARCVGRAATLIGYGHATGDHTWSGEWLREPAATTQRAGAQAYRAAGIDDPLRQVAVLQHSAPTPALEQPVLVALGLDRLDRYRVNPTGGPAGGFAGVANGAVRLIDAVTWLERDGGDAPAVVHSCDLVTGPVADDVTVLVIEAA